jgi:phage gp29-like protein
MSILARWAERAGRGATRASRTGRVDVVAPTSLWLQQGRIGGELTPKQVGEIILQADVGYTYRLVDLAAESRERDCHLHACLSTLELSLAGLELQIIPASDKRRDRKIAVEVEQVLNDFGNYDEQGTPQGLSDLIGHLAGAFYYGHAVAELVWLKKLGKLIPVAAVHVEARRFIIDPATCKLHFYEPFGTVPYPGVNLLEEYPNRFVQFTPRVLGTGVAREGLMHPLVWAALFRNWTTRDWMNLAELAWKPWRIGKYDKDEFASEADIQALLQALEFVTASGATLLPNTVELEVQWPGQKGSGHESAHERLCMFMASEMSKAILGQTMTTDDGSSYSQAQVHWKVAVDRRDSAARTIANLIRWQIVMRYLRLNYGPDTPVPRVRLVANDVDLAQLAIVLQQLTAIGLPIATSYIYKMFGMPAPKPGDEVVGNPIPARIPTEDQQVRIALKSRIRVLEDEEAREGNEQEMLELEAERERHAELEARRIDRGLQRQALRRAQRY